MLKYLLLFGLTIIPLRAQSNVPIVSGRTPVQNATNGNCLYNNAGRLGNKTCGGGGGSVTSVGLSTNLGTVTGSPVTTSGTITNTVSAAQVVALFSTCSGVQYLGADGSCHNSGGGGATIANTTLIIKGDNVGNGIAASGADVCNLLTLTGPITTSAGCATTVANSVALPGSPTTTTQSAGDSSTKVSTTAFVTTAVNNAIAGVNPAVAVQAATTTAGNTSGLTYNNGVSGVGATFTGSVNTAITIDGFTFTALGQRLLVKNDTQSPSGAFNGIYSLTVLQTIAVAPVFTRALDYDMPSDINNTGAIPVVNGTVNGSTSWLLTSTVGTVGMDPLTFVQFSLNPATVLVSGGALGTPSSGNASNLTNLPITLTTTGSSGASTYTQSTNTLNIPQYSGGGGTGVLGSTFIATLQTINTTSFSDLSTPDTLTFSCSATCNYVIQYTASSGTATNNNNNCGSSIFVDTVQVDVAQPSFVQNPGNTIPGWWIPSVAQWKITGAASGSHTVDVKHNSTNGTGVICTFFNRLLMATLVP